MSNIEKLRFNADGLIPAVVVDYLTREVLTLAYMNKESLEISMKEGKTCFWSRSRKELWRKGETSGNFQHIVKITTDCDCDALSAQRTASVLVSSKTSSSSLTGQYSQVKR